MLTALPSGLANIRFKILFFSNNLETFGFSFTCNLVPCSSCSDHASLLKLAVEFYVGLIFIYFIYLLLGYLFHNTDFLFDMSWLEGGQVGSTFYS